MTKDIIITKSTLEKFAERINDKSKPPIPVTMATDELKTLKDIDPKDNFKHVDDLRAEAIHRAKTKIGYLRNNRAVKKFWFNKHSESPMVLIDTSQGTPLMALAWTTFGEIQEIIKFNNLTEADLK